MNKWILAAAVSSAITVFLHVIGGGADVHQPILSGGLSQELNAYVSIIWHMATAMMVIDSGVLFLAVNRGMNATILVWIVVGHYSLTAALFIFYGIIRLGSIFIMPQWSFFILISVLALMGLRSQKGYQIP